MSGKQQEQGRRVIVFGIGDFARVAAVYLDEDSSHEVVAFTAHESYASNCTEFLGRPVVPFEDLEKSHPPTEYAMLVAIGFSKVNEVRAEIFDECRTRGYEPISYVSSRSTLVGPVEIGSNCFVFDENTIQPGVTVGDDVVMWSGNHIGHDTTIGDHCFIASHAVISGNCTIGEYCFVGVNATFRDGVTVGPRCVIGAGALVMKDVEEGSVLAVRGTPPLEKKSWEINL